MGNSVIELKGCEMKKTHLMVVAFLLVILMSFSVSAFVIRSNSALKGGLITGLPVLEFNDMDFSFTNNEGIDYNLQLRMHSDIVNIVTSTGEFNLHFYEAQPSLSPDISFNEYFVVTKTSSSKPFTHILRYIGHDSVNKQLTFTDLGTGTREITYALVDTPSGIRSVGDLVVGGVTYQVNINPGTGRIVVDQNGDGKFTGSQAHIVDINDKVYTQEYFTKGEVPEPTPEPVQSCTDSDGGIVADIKGFLNTNWPGWQPNVPDKCGVLVAPGNYQHIASCSGNDCYLLELYCSQGTPQRDFISCATGCSDGVCSDNVAKDCDKLNGMDVCLDNQKCYWDQETDKCFDYDNTKQKCTDPDGGTDYFKQAHTFGFRKIFANERDSRIRTGGLDSCLGSTLREHFCADEYFIEITDVPCNNGCQNGACASQQSTASDIFYIETQQNKLNIHEKFSSVVETITGNVWSYLPSGTIGSTKYNQYLRLGHFASNYFKSNSVIFAEDERDFVDKYLFFDDGDMMFEYELEFEGGLQTAVVDGKLVELDSKTISVLGVSYTIQTSMAGTRDEMKFVLEGLEQIVFKDKFDDAQYSRGVAINNDPIDDGLVRIIGSWLSQDVFEISSIRYILEADANLGDVYIPAGNGLRQQLDEPEGLLGSWDMVFEGIEDAEVTIVRIDAAGNDEYDLEFTNQEDIFYDVPLASNEIGTPGFKFGDDDDDLWFVEHENFVIGDDDFFVLSDCLVSSPTDNTCFSHVLRFDSIDTTNRQLTFTDLGTGTREITYDANGDSEIVVGGVAYKVKVSGDSIAIDLNGDGNIVTGTKAVIGVKGGGLLSIVSGTSALDDPGMTSASPALISPPQSMFTISLATLSKKFNDPSTNEEILIDIEARPNNMVGISQNIRAVTGTLSDLLNREEDINIHQAMSNYGVFMELFDPALTNDAEDLTIEYPLNQLNAKVYVGPMATAIMGPPLRIEPQMPKPAAIVEEDVTCMFRNSQTEQTCKSEVGSCTGKNSCVATAKGESGKEISWTSTCRGELDTIMDGKRESLTFNCRATRFGGRSFWDRFR